MSTKKVKTKFFHNFTCPSGLPKRLARDEAVGVSNLSGTQKEEFCDLQSRGVATLEPLNDSLSSSKPPRRLPIQDCKIFLSW